MLRGIDLPLIFQEPCSEYMFFNMVENVAGLALLEPLFEGVCRKQTNRCPAEVVPGLPPIGEVQHSDEGSILLISLFHSIAPPDVPDVLNPTPD